MRQEVFVWNSHLLILNALQPANRCEVHADLRECGDRLAEDYRVDSETGQCMVEGWVFLGGMYYIADELRAEALCRRLWGAGLEEVYSKETDDVYYTEWE
ncbi:hypothetical protein [Rothia nasimurium]|uniref:hypothetical protein n=1 Tax=Rothia nasimurium TaxID=85336 RepID=UPI001F467305|nr:hypothetical protein [Rothia nasimurium]